MTRRDDLPIPDEGFVVTHFLTVGDVERSTAFYRDVLGGDAVHESTREGEPAFVKLANSWIILNVGGGPTDDKPDVTLTPPKDPHRASAFLNLRVADVRKQYERWKGRGAEFLTPPKDHGQEIRCYIRDPDGYLIEVGETVRAP